MPLYDDHGRMIPSGTRKAEAQATAQIVALGSNGPTVATAKPATAAGNPPVRATDFVRAAVAASEQGDAPEPAPVRKLEVMRKPDHAASITETYAPVFSIGAAGDVFSAAAVPIDGLLSQMLALGDGVSDLFFIVGRPPQVESFGQLMPVPGTHYDEGFEGRDLEGFARWIIGNNARLLDDLRETGSCDSSYALGDVARFRVNVFRQKGSFAIVMRKLNTAIPSL